MGNVDGTFLDGPCLDGPFLDCPSLDGPCYERIKDAIVLELWF